MTDADRRLPRLSPGWTEQATALNPAEGFLLSRIDGHTPWAVLRQIGGLSPEKVDLALESWVKIGLVLLDEVEPPRPAKRSPGGDVSGVPAPDPSLDLDVELQAEILAFEARLGHATYHEILGVERGTEARQIKRAYFQLSKRFHPDRYFRRNIGDHALRLDRIFKHVVEAYELLSDPTTRTEIERTMEIEPPPLAPDAGAYRHAGTGQAERVDAREQPRGYRTPSRMENLERLRRRFKMPEKVLVERRFKASQFYQSAQVAAHQKSWLEAAASARLAIAFDPWNPEYKGGFASIQAEVHAMRATALLEEAQGASAKAEALSLLEEAIHYRPADATLHARAARLALETGDLEGAQEYAQSACELAPEIAGNHLTLCRVLRRKGLAKEAQSALAVAVRLAPKDPEVASEQQLMRRGQRR